MKKLKFILLFIFLIANLSDCRKKYEEDPFFSTKSPQRRLAGNWELVSVFVNGADSTEYVRSSGGCACKLYIDIDRDKGVLFNSCNITNAACGDSKEWGWDNNRNLSMQGYLVYPVPMSPHPTTPGVMYVSYLTHYILKLYKGELKFKVTQPDNQKEYIYEYKQYYSPYR